MCCPKVTPSIKLLFRLLVRNSSSNSFSLPIILPPRNNFKNEPTPSQPQNNSSLSKRKQFMAITCLPSTLAMIKDMGLGENCRPKQKLEDHKFLYPRPGKQPLDFIAAAKTESSFWPNNEKVPEIAIIGRSNVGKSRLLNVLFGTSNARVKNKPGLTQSINWYKTAAPMQALVVDMPGYGFAYAKPEVLEAWHTLIDRFFHRPSISRAILLIDARHGLKINDIEFLAKLVQSPAKPKAAREWIQIIMTKCDLVPVEILTRRHRVVCEAVAKHGLENKDVTMVSSQTGAGIVELRKSLMCFVKSLRKPSHHL